MIDFKTSIPFQNDAEPFESDLNSFQSDFTNSIDDPTPSIGLESSLTPFTDNSIPFGASHSSPHLDPTTQHSSTPFRYDSIPFKASQIPSTLPKPSQSSLFSSHSNATPVKSFQSLSTPTPGVSIPFNPFQSSSFSPQSTSPAISLIRAPSTPLQEDSNPSKEAPNLYACASRSGSRRVKRFLTYSGLGISALAFLIFVFFLKYIIYFGLRSYFKEDARSLKEDLTFFVSILSHLEDASYY